MSSGTKDVEAGEKTPLVATPQRDDDDDANEEEPPPLEDMEENCLKEKVVAGTAAVCFGTSVGAMIMESNPVVYVSGTIGAGIAPYAAIQQQKITQVEALRQTNERMGEEVSQLKDENFRLQTTVGELETTVAHLEEMQDTLETIQATEGQSIKELEKQLAESQEILGKMENNLKGDVLQNIISVAMTSDVDRDERLSDAEIDGLIVKLEGLHGLQLNEDLIKEKIVGEGRSLNAIMELARDLLSDGVEQGVFNILEDE